MPSNEEIRIRLDALGQIGQGLNSYYTKQRQGMKQTYTKAKNAQDKLLSLASQSGLTHASKTRYMEQAAKLGGITNVHPDVPQETDTPAANAYWNDHEIAWKGVTEGKKSAEDARKEAEFAYQTHFPGIVKEGSGDQFGGAFKDQRDRFTPTGAPISVQTPQGPVLGKATPATGTVVPLTVGGQGGPAGGPASTPAQSGGADSMSQYRATLIKKKNEGGVLNANEEQFVASDFADPLIRTFFAEIARDPRNWYSIPIEKRGEMVVDMIKSLREALAKDQKQGGKNEFATIEEAKKAGLPTGTKITVGGRPAVIE